MATITTFILGNGLDLSLGMKTSYQDFYQYVQSHNLHPENRIYKAIQESTDSWSDFELALGKYTQYIDNDKLSDKQKVQESIALHDELSEFRNDLADYLTDQEESIGGQIEANKLTLSTMSFFNELPSGQRDIVSRLSSNGPRQFNFITLNYTQTLERILSQRDLLTMRSIAVKDPHHIHGDLSADMTLGVSDESQLSDKMSTNERNDLIKPVLIDSMNDGRIKTLNQIISESSILVLFGTSIGDTDKYIWGAVINWLSSSPARYVIVHKHDDSYTEIIRRDSRKHKEYVSAVQQRLLAHSGLDGDQIAELKKRIFVIHNTKLLFYTDNGV